MLTKNIRITFDEFRHQLREKFSALNKGPFPKCPMCDTTGWTCPGFKETPSHNWEGTEDGVVVTIPLICNTCGYVAHFAMNAFRGSGG